MIFRVAVAEFAENIADDFFLAVGMKFVAHAAQGDADYVAVELSRRPPEIPHGLARWLRRDDCQTGDFPEVTNIAG